MLERPNQDLDQCMNFIAFLPMFAATLIASHNAKTIPYLVPNIVVLDRQKQNPETLLWDAIPTFL